MTHPDFKNRKDSDSCRDPGGYELCQSKSFVGLFVHGDDWTLHGRAVNMAELHVMGQVLGASGFAGHSIFCKVRVK